MSDAFQRLASALVPAAAALAVSLGQNAMAGSPGANSELKPVLVFAAASLKSGLDPITKRWQAETGNAVTVAYAASPALARQIEAGAPADLFASADVRWMDWAEEKKLIDPASRVALLGNALVLIAPRDAIVDLSIEKGFGLAAAIGDGKLATGEPIAVPLGTYAKAALTSLGVWDAVAPKIAATDSAASALAFVAREEANFGIVYKTDALSEPLVKVAGTFPAESHPPIVYPFALTSTARNPRASELLAYLRSPAAAVIWEGQGFVRLDK